MSLARPNSRRHYTLPGEFLSIPERGRINAFFKLKILFKPWLPLCSPEEAKCSWKLFSTVSPTFSLIESLSLVFFFASSPLPPSPFLFYFRESRFRRENDRGNVKMKNFSKFSFKIYSYSIENRCSKFTAVSPIQIWQSPLHNSSVRKS